MRKQLHAVPDAPVVQRETFILERCRDKVVLDIGASGPMHDGIVKVAKFCYGIDAARETLEAEQGPNWHNEYMDLDEFDAQIPRWWDVEIVVCGEVIEHLSNPGFFLERLREAYKCQTIITVPNAFAEAGRKSLERGVENVNREHVAYYSYQTLKELVTRHGYSIVDFAWYNGRPKFSEGLIFVVE